MYLLQLASCGQGQALLQPLLTQGMLLQDCVPLLCACGFYQQGPSGDTLCGLQPFHVLLSVLQGRP